MDMDNPIRAAKQIIEADERQLHQRIRPEGKKVLVCGEPSGIRVARWAKLGASSKALISSESGIAMRTVLALR